MEIEPADYPAIQLGRCLREPHRTSSARGLMATQTESLTTNGRWSGYAGLLSARMKELFREPEVLFWIFLFPILLAFGLGIAFRNRPVEKINVVFAEQAGSAQ